MSNNEGGAWECPRLAGAGMTALDIFVILLLGGAALVGFVRGLVHEVLALAAWIVGIAALKAGKIAPSNGPIATIITGRNLDMRVFTDIVSGQSVALGDKIIKGRAYAA